MRLPRTRLTVANLIRVGVLAACSAALLHQSIASAYITRIGIQIRYVLLPLETLSLASALAALTAWSAAQLVPTTWILTPQPENQATTGLLLRRGFLSAAGLSLAVAGLWALAAMVSIGLDEADYLQATFVPAGFIAASAAVVAVFASRVPADRLLSWLDRISPPLVPIVLAATGIYLQNLQYWQRGDYWIDWPFGIAGLSVMAEYCGAVLLGVGTALTVTRHLFLRVTASVLLATGYALMANYVIAVVWWAVAAAAATVMASSTGVVTSLRRWFNPPAS